MARHAKELERGSLIGSLGFPFYSMPACGTHTEQTENLGLLCLRWFQLASFMPGIHSWYQDHDNARTATNLPKTYGRYVRWALELRYRLLPYFYTLDREWYNKSRPLVRPMFYQQEAIETVDIWNQFYLGPNIIVAPVLKPDSEFVNIHLPTGSWYVLGTGSFVNQSVASGSFSFHAKIYRLPAFYRGGSVLVMYDKAGTTIKETEKNGLELVVGLECKPTPRKMHMCRANGASYLRSGVTITTGVTSNTNKGNITITVDRTDMEGELISQQIQEDVVQEVVVSGLRQPANSDGLTVTLPDGEELIANTNKTAQYDGFKQILLLRSLNIPLENKKTITWEFKKASNYS